MQYIERFVKPTLDRYLKSFPVVGLTGPRQSGKTTLLQHALPDYRYVTMDDVQYASFLESDPQAFFDLYNDKVIFDEVHYTPDIFRHVKVRVDQDRKSVGRYVLTSSSQFAYSQHVSESLAGRIGLLSLLPLQCKEMPAGFSKEVIIRGSYPELVNTPSLNRDDWYASYVATYLDKDVRLLSNIGNMNDFRRFIKLLAANIASIFNMQHYASEIGVSVPTIKRWVAILEASYMVFFLYPYHRHFGKRVVKSPKIYFYDTGLVCYLTGIETVAHYENGPMAGALFENYVIAEIMKREIHMQTHNQLYYLRTSNGQEVDLVIEQKQHTQFCEIKKSATFSPNFIKPLKSFVGEGDEGFLLYNGKMMQYSDVIQAMPFVDFL